MSYLRENWSAFTRLKFQQDNLVFKGLKDRLKSPAMPVAVPIRMQGLHAIIKG